MDGMLGNEVLALALYLQVLIYQYHNQLSHSDHVSYATTL